MNQQNNITVDFYLKDTIGDETRVTKTINCDEVDHDNLEGLFDEFKYFLKAVSYCEEIIDGQLQFMGWMRIGYKEEEKWLKEGDIVLISKGGECEPYEYNGAFPDDANYWCYLPRGYGN